LALLVLQDGRVLTASSRNKLYLWTHSLVNDARVLLDNTHAKGITGLMRLPLAQHQPQPLDAPKGETVCSGSTDGTVCGWRIHPIRQTAHCLFRIQLPLGKVSAWELIHDRYIVAVTADDPVRMYDVRYACNAWPCVAALDLAHEIAVAGQ